MIEAFVTKHGGIYPFRHVTYAYTGSYNESIRIETTSSNREIIELIFNSIEDKNRQLHNFMQYLTKSEPTTTKLS